jgi:hypothetical protein
MTEPVDNESPSGKTFVKLSPKSSPPNVFIAGPVSESPGCPTVREPHRPEGNRGIEAFGNNKILEVWKSRGGFPTLHRSDLYV